MTNPDAEQTGTSAQRLATIQAAADDVVTRVNEWTDRTSPEDFPEALLITSSELHRELMRFAEDIGALNRTAASQDAREALTERSAFIKSYRHLDLTEISDAWGRPMFMHTHVQALWDGWFARAALAAPQPQAGASEPVAWNNQHPLWEEFHDIVGDAVIDIVNHWRNDSDTGGVRHAHQKFAEAGKEIIDLFAFSSSRIESIDEEHPDCRTARECELYDALMVLGSCAAAHYRDYRNWIQGGVKVEPIVSKALRLSGAIPSPTEAGRADCGCTDECLHKPDCVFERDPQESAPK